MLSEPVQGANDRAQGKSQVPCIGDGKDGVWVDPGFAVAIAVLHLRVGWGERSRFGEGSYSFLSLCATSTYRC